MNEMNFRARVWKFPENVNTDQIIPNRAYYLSPQEQLPFIFDAMRHWLG